MNRRRRNAQEQATASFLLLALLAGCGSSSDPATAAVPCAKAGSAFDTDEDGWTIVGDAQSSSAKPDHVAAGGNPGGAIRAKDNQTGGVWYFTAPDKYHGPAAGSLGKKLTFDLQTDAVDNPFTAYDVLLSGGGVTIVTTSPEDPLPVNSWKSYAVVVGPEAGWQVVTSASIDPERDLKPFPPATDADLRAVLSDVTLFNIRGEYNTGPDTGFLDNVCFGAP